MNTIKKFFENPIFKMIKNIISWVVIGLLILLALFLMYYMISSKLSMVKGKKFEPKFSLYTIISTSMEPNIKVYDVVFDAKINANKIKEGDVITFISSSSLSEGMTITHRVISVVETETGRKFRVKGDNNSTPDSSLVDEKNILGKVMFKLPQVGRIQFLLQSRGGWLFVLLIPALFVVIYDILKVVRLSNAKVLIEETLKEPEEDLELKKKEIDLKKRLKSKKKIIGVVPVDPIIQTIKEDNNIKKKNKVVKEEKLELAEKELYNEKLDEISNNLDNKSSKELVSDFSEKKNKAKNKTLQKKNEELNDYNINIKLDDIYKNINDLDEDEDFMPKSK